MAVKMVREPSETPNISNVDDFVGLRYAYGNQDGYVINKLNECSFEIIGNTFKVNSGRVVIQGIETDIDANGVSIIVDSIATKRFYSVYLEVNLETMTSSIKSSYDTAGYPIIDKGDDLTKITNGIARLLLYTFDASNGIITNVQKKANAVRYAKDIVVENAKTINGLPIVMDSDGVIRFNELIIPYQKLIFTEVKQLSNTSLTTIYTDIASFKGRSFKLGVGIRGLDAYIPCVLKVTENTSSFVDFFVAKTTVHQGGSFLNADLFLRVNIKTSSQNNSLVCFPVCFDSNGNINTPDANLDIFNLYEIFE